MFGGEIADYSNLGSNSFFTHASVVEYEVKLAFIYSKRKIITEYTTSYEDTGNYGIVTKIDGPRKINGNRWYSFSSKVCRLNWREYK